MLLPGAHNLLGSCYYLNQGDYKRCKGNPKECKNWRGITLWSLSSKVMGKIVIGRIRRRVESKLRKKQVGFRAGRGVTGQISILRNIKEIKKKKNAPSALLNYILHAGFF